MNIWNLGRVENIVGKGGNASFSRSQKVGIVWKKGYNPFPEQQILDSSKLKEFADDNFNLMKMAEISQNL